MRKVLAAAASLLAVLSFSAEAASFNPTQNYTEGQFGDVNSDSWYASSVKSAYELSFMNGTSSDVFSPDGNVTLAQALTVASRINAIYNQKQSPENSKDGNWYDSYVKYAVDAGIITENRFSDYSEPATRAQVAEIFANSLPESYYTVQNEVDRVPDVPSTNAYADQLLMLYKAGVVMGNDEYGTFFPDSNIKRSEMAAIINRVAIPENRLKKTLTLADYEDAYYLIDDATGIATNTVNIYGTSWNYDNRDQILSVTNIIKTLNDSSNTHPVTVWKDFVDQDKGLLTLEINTSVTTPSDTKSGIYYEITDDNKNSLMRFELVNGEFLFNGKPTGFKHWLGSFGLSIEMDLDKRVARLYIKGKDYGEYSLTDATAGRLYISTTEKDRNCAFSVSKVVLYRNYLVNEKFDIYSDKKMPVGWETTGSIAPVSIAEQPYNDADSALITADDKGTHTAKKSFNKISGNVVFESYVLLPEYAGRATVTLLGGSDKIASIYLDGNSSYADDGTKLLFHRNNIWQTLRIEANTTTGVVTYKVNGKTVHTAKVSGMPTFADSIEIKYEAQKASQMYFDDIEVYLTHEYDDYCPEPVPAFSDKYDVILNVCSLWHQGQHRGWEAVSAYDDKEPYLGFYDEGLTELADWEIKYMVEHGINVQHLCWYCPSDNIKNPIKKSRMNDALHDGFFNAKYSNMMDFTFMWENSGTNSHSLEQFKEYIWNYWVDYYFTDPRFYTVNNKVVFTVWNYNNFKNAFGGVEGAKAAKAFMDEDIKKYGFDGVILLFADGHNQSAEPFRTMASIGGDGSYAYHWNQDGIYASRAMPRMQKNADFNEIFIVPTASVGFNNIGWDFGRKPMASLEEHKKQLEYIRDTYLPTKENDAEDWHSKMVIISTWNEYGEGTYVMPAGVHGFGYLDNIREVLVGDNADMSPYNVKPTAQQKARLGHMYTGDMTTLMTTDLTSESSDEIPKEKAFTIKLSAWQNGFGTKSFSATDSLIKVSASGKDHGIMLKKAGFAASEVDAIHVRIKSPTPTKLEIFFTTAADGSWTQAKSFGADYNSGEYVDLYFHTSTNSAWTGNISQLRLDPATDIVDTEITAIDFLTYSEDQTDYSLNIDSIEYSPSDKITYVDGEYYVPAEPIKGFFSLHNFYYEWSRFTGRLYILSKNNTSLEFNVGSDKVLVNGKEQTLKKPLSLIDGLPNLPYTWLLEQIGTSITSIEGKTIKVNMVDPKYADIINSRKANEWEFNLPGDIENWQPNFMTTDVTDGILNCTAVERPGQSPLYDAMLAMKDIKLDASHYYKMVVRFKCDIPEGTKTNSSVYFATDTDKSLNQAKNVGIDITSEDGKTFKEYTFDFSKNERWNGYVTELRFDPISGGGSCSIDYIRFVYDQKGLQAVTYNEKEFEILNGDASDAASKAFFSNNATVTIVKDNDKKDDNVFNIASKDGKQWSYLRQKVTYTPGASYKVSFDAKFTGTNDGNIDKELASQIHVNARYNDGEKTDHVIKAMQIKVSDGWIKFECTYEIPATSSLRDSDEFTIYMNPIGEFGCNYRIDNVVVEEILSK